MSLALKKKYEVRGKEKDQQPPRLEQGQEPVYTGMIPKKLTIFRN